MRVSLSIVLSVFIVAFFILVALRPTFVTIATLNNEIEQSEATLSKLEAKVLALERAAQVWDTLKAGQPDIEEAIPQADPEYGKFAAAMEVLAQEAGVNFNGYSMGKALIRSEIVEVETGKKQEVIETAVTMRITGGFPQMYEFITKLMELDRMIAIESVSVAKEAAVSSALPQVGMSVSGTVQYLADENQLAKILSEEEDK
jgi:Tfp pilus assembly protein PilO